MVRISLSPASIYPRLIKRLHLIVWSFYLHWRSHFDCGFFKRRQSKFPV